MWWSTLTLYQKKMSQRCFISLWRILAEINMLNTQGVFLSFFLSFSLSFSFFFFFFFFLFQVILHFFFGKYCFSVDTLKKIYSLCMFVKTNEKVYEGNKYSSFSINKPGSVSSWYWLLKDTKQNSLKEGAAMRPRMGHIKLSLVRYARMAMLLSSLFWILVSVYIYNVW